jgi:hypothetical protein
MRATENAGPAPAAEPPVAMKPKLEIDPLYADIEKQLGDALARPPSPPPAPSRAAPPPVRREPAAEPSAPPPAAKEPAKSHLDALEEEMASLLGRERPS